MPVCLKNNLVRIANKLDQRGFFDLANKLDIIIRSYDEHYYGKKDEMQKQPVMDVPESGILTPKQHKRYYGIDKPEPTENAIYSADSVDRMRDIIDFVFIHYGGRPEVVTGSTPNSFPMIRTVVEIDIKNLSNITDAMINKFNLYGAGRFDGSFKLESEEDKYGAVIRIESIFRPDVNSFAIYIIYETEMNSGSENTAKKIKEMFERYK